MNGLLVLDKPEGPTSFDMVARVRRATGERRVGHAGTLDPMATGVLLVCLGEATKIVPFLLDVDKEYRATMRLGITTDTDDAAVGARVLAEADPARLRALDEEQVRAALLGQRGTVVQRPPRFSALKVQGRRLYERARAGDKALEADLLAKQRPVEIHDIDLEEVDLPQVTFRVRCGKGTYVRAIARDVGERLGVGAHLTALRRLRVGRFPLAAATPLTADGPRGHRFAGPVRLFAPAEALAHLPAARVSETLAARVRAGQAAAVAEAAREVGQGAAHATVLDPAGRLVAVLGHEGGTWRIVRGFTT